MSKDVTKPAEKKNDIKGFFYDNTEVVEVNGRKVRVFSQEADKLRKKLANAKKGK